MRKTCFILVLVIVLLLTGCLNAGIKKGSVSVQLDFPEGMKAEQLGGATIMLQISKGNSTFSRTISDMNSKIIFEDLEYGSWNVSVIVKDLAGQTMLMGNNTVVITSKEISRVTVSLGYMYQINVTVKGGGTVTTFPNQEAFRPGTKVRISALPEEGWAFSQWDGDIEGSKESLTIEVNSHMNITAVFFPLKAGIALTFDDWNIKSWYSIKDLLVDYHAKATFFVGRFHTLKEEQIEQLRELHRMGNEIGFHSVNHINAVEFLNTRSVEEYIQQEINPGLQLMRDHGFHPTSFAYPFGARKIELDEQLLKCFQVIRGTKYPTGPIKDMEDVYCKSKEQRLIFGVGIDDSYEHSLEEIYGAIDQAYETNSVLVMYSHNISDHGGSLTISAKKIKAIFEYVSNKKMKFYTATEIVS